MLFRVATLNLGGIEPLPLKRTLVSACFAGRRRTLMGRSGLDGVHERMSATSRGCVKTPLPRRCAERRPARTLQVRFFEDCQGSKNPPKRLRIDFSHSLGLQWSVDLLRQRGGDGRLRVVNVKPNYLKSRLLVASRPSSGVRASSAGHAAVYGSRGGMSNGEP